jgi:glycosyltransferase involved in cell wall biosynthesis
MNICFFGAYDKDRNVNRVILNGLKKIKDIEIIEINLSAPNLARDFLFNQRHLFTLKYFKSFLTRNLFLIKEYLNKRNVKIDCIYIGYPGQESIFSAYFLRFICQKFSHKKIPIILNPYTCLTDSIITDYRKLSRYSFLARFYYIIEYLSFHFADILIANSYMEKNRYSSLFHINPDKIFRIFLGADEELFFPQEFEGKKNKFVIGFNGNYIPLHGIDIIIKSAKIIELYSKNIIFEIVGGTKQEIYEKKEMVKNLHISNVRFIPHIPINQIPQTIAKSDIQLGIFGSTPKAKRIIPNKVFTALAMKKPIITSNTKAIRELLTKQLDCLLCNIADPISLANNIITLYEDSKLRNKIASNGYKLFQEKLNSKKLSMDLIDIINTF